MTSCLKSVLIAERGQAEKSSGETDAQKVFPVFAQMYQADILDLLEPNPDASLLDVGCDDGKWTECLLSKIGSRSVFGIDVVDEALLKAKQKCVEVVKSDVSNGFPFRDCTFDVVHSNQVIEHLHKTERFVKELFRVRTQSAVIGPRNTDFSVQNDPEALLETVCKEVPVCMFCVDNAITMFSLSFPQRLVLAAPKMTRRVLLPYSSHTLALRHAGGRALGEPNVAIHN